MCPATAIDVHAHYFGVDLPQSSGPDALAPALVVDSAEHGRIMLGNTVFREVTSELWDVAERLRAMDDAGLSHQVISPVPVMMEYACAEGADPRYAGRVNESIAAVCGRSDGRLIGLGCLPLADVSVAVEELGRCLDLGLRGIEIGTRVGDRDLDAPELDALWEACDTTGAAVFVHPVHGGKGVVRRAGQPFDLGLGMLTDTAIAAGALVFGGVLERYPRIRVAFAHGCGAFPWVYPRLRSAASIFGSGDPAVSDTLVRRLYADTLVFDDEHLRLLLHRFGPDRLLLGSDAPFFRDQMHKSMRSIDNATESGILPGDVASDVLVRNALEFLGIAGDF
ncbi:amidohydrolase family protein [Nocardia jiangxiensis]|uniref:2-amino-3-carboxymuconate-6-semialdehyde decarboxylase n=1 Tax=Nocardia jiangxiensis TaxID=282685 RepID=A0ABW6S8Y8_9NOCA|nr:amidohydrolase family protein [Nocardia jiangxiensis]